MKKSRLKILLVNNFSTVRGGSDRCFENLKVLLESHGHTVQSFTAEESGNLVDWKAAQAGRYLYNRKALSDMTLFLKGFKPDIAHCHNIYGHLTPSILLVLKERAVPVVMTLHDWKLICPNHRLFTQGALCERCKGGRYFESLRNRCFKNSWMASLLGMVEAYFHHAKKYYENHVDLFISPSRFLKQKFLEFGWPGERIKVIPNFVAFAPQPAPSIPGEGLVYFGSVVEEKGVGLLLEAMERVAIPTCLKIVGEGDHLDIYRRRAKAIRHPVGFLSFQRPPELYSMIQSALFSVLPSIWYENQPLSILESYGLGKAVVGANHGGIAELIEDKKTGLLFGAGDPQSLADKITELLQDPLKTAQMGEKGRQKAQREFSPSLHYERLMEAYRGLLPS